ncbi:hypothetical protein RBI65_17595 [Acinetobacter baumannii]|uniref:hypothetical protein n=1 Tax=Acinetobacter baumannii TaxID=470 RepID=UPI001FF3620F|nr:hypothetical protein [Acinetobacter baumannii]EKV6547414.1 hypothetical protein [Acinetobacter baumannii]ELB0409812.1 hypothetical protein [Acinetobacter baumannii]MCJ9255938.1 hypothetical protein [Acinetobacter baumannii]MDQ2466365.1 hypothetical protein [Acinetobacter baumannii]
MTPQEIWTWLDENSGQLQTIFSFLGLALGIFAIWYAKKQINLAQSQRTLDLRLQILQLSKDLLRDIRIQRAKFKAFRDQIKKGMNPEIAFFQEQTIQEFDKAFDFYISLLDNPEDLAKKLVAGASDFKLDIESSTLEEYLTTLHSIQVKLESAHEGLNAHVIRLFGKEFLNSI